MLEEGCAGPDRQSDCGPGECRRDQAACQALSWAWGEDTPEGVATASRLQYRGGVDRAKQDPMTHGSLFAGIGGFDLGFERAGIKTI